MKYAWDSTVNVAAAGFSVTSRYALVVQWIFLLLHQSDPVLHFVNSASV